MSDKKEMKEGAKASAADYITLIRDSYEDGIINAEERQELERKRVELGLSQEEAVKLEDSVVYEWSTPMKLMGLVMMIGFLLILLVSITTMGFLLISFLVLSFICSRLMKVVAGRTTGLFGIIMRRLRKRDVPDMFCFVEAHMSRLQPSNLKQWAHITMQKTLFPTLFAFFLMSLFLGSSSISDAIIDGAGKAGGDNIFSQLFVLSIFIFAPIATGFSAIILVFQDSSLMIHSVKKRQLVSFGYLINQQFRAIGGFGALMALLSRVIEIVTNTQGDLAVPAALLIVFLLTYPVIFVITLLYLKGFHQDIVRSFDEGIKHTFPEFRYYRFEQDGDGLSLLSEKMAHQTTTTLDDVTAMTAQDQRSETIPSDDSLESPSTETMEESPPTEAMVETPSSEDTSETPSTESVSQEPDEDETVPEKSN